MIVRDDIRGLEHLQETQDIGRFIGRRPVKCSHFLPVSLGQGCKAFARVISHDIPFYQMVYSACVCFYNTPILSKVNSLLRSMQKGVFEGLGVSVFEFYTSML